MRRAALLYNPAARKAPNLDLLRTAAAQIDGWSIDLRATEREGHATDLAAAAAADGYDAVVACGGDGTVNEVANGLVGTATALAVIRAGTANVWAKEIRVPKDLAKALGVLATGNVRTIDVGRAGTRYFVCMAGAGFDAAIVKEQAGSSLKRRLGAAAYVVNGFRLARTRSPVTCELSYDAQPSTGNVFWLIVANTRSYGGVLNIAHMARADDGQLDSFALARGGLWQLIRLLPLVLLKRHHRSRLIAYRTVQELDIRTPGLPVQVDGEYVGESPLRFEVVPSALRVVVPKALSSPLFSSGSP